MHLFKPSLLFSAVLLITSFSIFAQSGEDHVYHFSLGVSAGLSVDQWNGNTAKEFGDSVTASFNGHAGYSGSITGAYSFCNHWKLKISPGVQSKKFDYRIDGLHFSKDFNGIGFNDSHIIYHIKATTLRVPVTVEYVLGTKKILPFFSVGLAAEFILNQGSDGTIYYSDGTIDPAGSGDALRKGNVVAIASAGIYYRLSSKISFSVSPEFCYSLLDDQLGHHQYSFGATAGAFYNISK